MWNNQTPRMVSCGKCGKSETEKVWGSGFTNWVHLREFLDEKGNTLMLCPDCNEELKKWLNGGK